MKVAILYILIFLNSFVIFSQNISNDDFIERHNKAAFDFYATHFKNNKNQVFSPLFFRINLSELYLATGGGTARQVCEFSFFDKDKQAHYRNMKFLQKEIKINNSLNTNFKYSINLFIEDSLKILDDFKKNISNYICCDSLTSIDFTQNKSDIANKINTIIEKNTDNYVKPYIDSNYIPDKPNIILNSTAFYSGFWANNFSNFIISEFKLDSTGRKKSNVKFLTAFDYYQYGETDDYQIIELPYEGYKYSLIIILPKQIRSLLNFENKFFNYPSYSMWRQYNMQREEVRLLLPEFEIKSYYSLKNNLDTIIPAVFTPGGNFLNLIKKIVFVNGIYHFSKIKVENESQDLLELKNINFTNEKKTNNSFIFNANHPFIFLVIDRQSEAVLFMGHLYSPE